MASSCRNKFTGDCVCGNGGIRFVAAENNFTGAGAGKFVESWAGAGKAIIGPAAPKASHQRA